jgi:hypothetical protein
MDSEQRGTATAHKPESTMRIKTRATVGGAGQPPYRSIPEEPTAGRGRIYPDALHPKPPKHKSGVEFMTTKRKGIFASAATLLALGAILLSASGVVAAQSRNNGAVRAGSENILIFTHDGKPIGGSKPPCLTSPAGAVVCANDLHFIWKYTGKCYHGIEFPPVVVMWTSFGRLVYSGKPTVAPCRANDFEFAWDANGNVTTASWTYNGKVIARIPVPSGPNTPINDAHVFWLGKGKLLTAYWSLNGKLYGEPLPVPAGTNDAHWVSPGLTTVG